MDSIESISGRIQFRVEELVTPGSSGSELF